MKPKIRARGAKVTRHNDNSNSAAMGQWYREGRQGRTGHGSCGQDGAGHGRTRQGSAGQDRGRGRGGAGTRQGRDKAGQGHDRKLRDNGKVNALGIAGHSALQDNSKGMMDCGIWRRAGQSGRQDREEDRALQ